MTSAPQDGVGVRFDPESADPESACRDDAGPVGLGSDVQGSDAAGSELAATHAAGFERSETVVSKRATGGTTVARAAGLIASVLMVAYPVAFFAGVMTGRLREASWVIAALLLPAALLRLRTLRWSSLRPGDLNTMAFVPVIALVLVGVSAALNDAGAALFVPVAVHCVLLVAFAPTLWLGPPMIERFARLQHCDLNPTETRWCRQWTVLWSCFFAVNIVLVTALALSAPLSWWAIYNGGIAYALMGTLLSVEWMLRKARFGRIGDSWAERVLVRWVPPVRRRFEADRALSMGATS